MSYQDVYNQMSKEDRAHYVSVEAEEVWTDVAAAYPEATEGQLCIAGENFDSFLESIYLTKEVTYREAVAACISAAVEFN